VRRVLRRGHRASREPRTTRDEQVSTRKRELIERTRLVGGSLEFQSSNLRNLFSDLDVETFLGVQPGSNSSTTLCQLAQAWENILNALNAVRDLSDIARKFLAERQGSSILQMGTANLDNMAKGLGLGFEGVMQSLQSREEGMGDFGYCRYVHHSWEAVDIELGKRG
jgi:hypothetical protein